MIARCLDSVADLVDEINIIDTGSTDRTKEIVARYTDRIFDFKWINDFAAARNYSFKQATKDYIFWLDADDYLLDKDQEALRNLKKDLNPGYDSVMMDYVLSRDFHGNAQAFTRRNRIVKRSRGFQWVNPVHEVLGVSGHVLPSGIEVTHESDREHKNKSRNLSILEEVINREESEMTPRVHFYYSNELMDNGRHDEAIESYLAFLKRDSENFEDNIAACGHLAHCYHVRGDRRAEISWLYQSFEYDLPRADFCCRIALWYEESEDYEKAIFWYELALTMEMPQNHFGLMNKICWTWAPHVQLTLCYGKLGQIKKAYEHNEKALSYLAGDGNLLANKQRLEVSLRELENVEIKALADSTTSTEEAGDSGEDEHHSPDM